MQPVIDWSSSIFTGGLLIALPIMIAMLLILGSRYNHEISSVSKYYCCGFSGYYFGWHFHPPSLLRGILQLIEEFWLNAFEQLSLIMVV